MAENIDPHSISQMPAKLNELCDMLGLLRSATFDQIVREIEFKLNSEESAPKEIERIDVMLSRSELDLDKDTKTAIEWLIDTVHDANEAWNVLEALIDLPIRKEATHKALADAVAMRFRELERKVSTAEKDTAS